MDPNQQIVQLLKRIQAALEEFKSEAKQQFSSNIDEGNWKAVDCLSECASWIDAGIDACAQMTARCASLEVDDLRQEASTSNLNELWKLYNSPTYADWADSKAKGFYKELSSLKNVNKIWSNMPSDSERMKEDSTPSFHRFLALLKEDGAPSESNLILKSKEHYHPFWSSFFDLGVPFHPELANKKPTGGGRKIGPTILPGIQIDVAHSTQGVSCRLLSSKPEKLKPLLKLKSQFEKAIDGEIEWNDGNKNRSHLSVTVRPASKLEQQSWTIEEKAGNLLKLYGQIKQFVIQNLD